jgi:hypothetical protein
MASSINASLTAGLVQTADTSGIINLQSGGTTVATISSTGLTSTGGALNGTLGATTPSTVVATTISGTDLTTTGNTILGNASTDTLNVGNGDLIKDASGNVGVGVTPSAWSSSFKAIEIGQAGAAIWGSTSAGSSYLRMNNASYYNGTNFIYSGTGSAHTPTMYVQTSNGSNEWSTAPSGTAGNAITFTQAMTLDASGNLGVGTATSGSIYMMNYAASTIGTRLGANPSDQTITLNTRNGVSGSASGTEIARLCWGYGGTDSAWISAERNGATGANRVNVVCSSAGVYLASAGTAWASLSDERQKTNLVPITDAIAKLNSLRTVTGRYIADEETISRAFLIAQEVQKVLPEAVDVQENEDGTLGLRYTDLIPLLIAGFKEQQALITSLTARLDEQQAQISVLQGAK